MRGVGGEQPEVLHQQPERRHPRGLRLAIRGLVREPLQHPLRGGGGGGVRLWRALGVRDPGRHLRIRQQAGRTRFGGLGLRLRVRSAVRGRPVPIDQVFAAKPFLSARKAHTPPMTPGGAIARPPVPPARSVA
jgi:hypothetical protein